MNDIQRRALHYIRDDMRRVLVEMINVQTALLQLRTQMTSDEWQAVQDILQADIREEMINSPDFAEGFALVWEKIKPFLPE